MTKTFILFSFTKFYNVKHFRSKNLGNEVSLKQDNQFLTSLPPFCKRVNYFNREERVVLWRSFIVVDASRMEFKNFLS